MNSLNRFADTIYCIARLIIGLMFACHGGQKILGFPPGGHGGAQGLMLVGGIVELVGGCLIAVGFLTRVAAFFAAGEMAVAYFMVHAKTNFFPIVNKGELAVAYCWFFLFVLFYGGGRWSIDGLIARNKPAPATRTAV
jgi:putative oxidoreductase